MKSGVGPRTQHLLSCLGDEVIVDLTSWVEEEQGAMERSFAFLDALMVIRADGSIKTKV